MISIKVEIPIQVEQLSKKYEEAAIEAVEKIGKAAYDKWQYLADTKLSRTRTAYVEAVKYQLVRPGEVWISMDSKPKDNFVPVALEAGLPPFSIADALLRKATKKPLKLPAFVRAKLDPAKREEVLKRVIVPMYPKGSTRGAPVGFRTLTDKNWMRAPNKWQHPGFRPAGKGGLAAPLREEVIKFIKDEAPEMMRKLLATVSV
jgi:hypothetical protein